MRSSGTDTATLPWDGSTAEAEAEYAHGVTYIIGIFETMELTITLTLTHREYYTGRSAPLVTS